MNNTTIIANGITSIFALPTFLMASYLTVFYIKKTLIIIKNSKNIRCILRPQCSIAIVMTIVFTLFATISAFNMAIRTFSFLQLNGSHNLSIYRSAATQLVAFILSVLFILEKNNHTK